MHVLWSHVCLMVSCMSYGLMHVLWSHACLMVSCMSSSLMHALWSHACLMVSCMFSNFIFYGTQVCYDAQVLGPWAQGPKGPRAHGPKAHRPRDPKTLIFLGKTKVFYTPATRRQRPRERQLDPSGRPTQQEPFAHALGNQRKNYFLLLFLASRKQGPFLTP